MSKKKYGLRTVVYDDTDPGAAQEKQGLSDWEIMRKLDDPELQQQLDETELSSLKKDTYKYNKDIGSFVNGYGEKAASAAEAISKNYKVRKAANRFIKNKDDLNRFMRARDMETFIGNKRTFENILDKLQKPKQATPIPTSSSNIANPGANMEEKIEPKPVKTTEDIIFENLLAKEKIKLANIKNYHSDLNELSNTAPDNYELDDEVNNQGLGTLKKYI